MEETGTGQQLRTCLSGDSLLTVEGWRYSIYAQTTEFENSLVYKRHL